MSVESRSCWLGAPGFAIVSNGPASGAALASSTLISVHLPTLDQVHPGLAVTAMLLQQSSWQAFMPILLMIGIFVMLVILPARKRQKKLEQMLADLSSGDRVVTNGGLTGTVVGLAEGSVTLRIAPDGVKLQFARSAVVGMAEKAGK